MPKGAADGFLVNIPVPLHWSDGARFRLYDPEPWMCPVGTRGLSIGKSVDYTPAVAQEALTGDNS